MHSIAKYCLILVMALLLAHTGSVLPLAHALSPATDLSKTLGIGGIGWPVTTQTGFEEGAVPSETDTSTSSGDVQLATRSDWYDANWGYRKPVTVTNNSGGVLTNYQVKVTVNTQELIPAKMQSDGADIRFTQSDGTTAMDYWMEFGYRKQLTIDSSKISSDLTDFPVLVKLTNSNFDFSKARSDGYDIRFTASDGSPLNYDRERHDSTNEVAEYWVKIPSVSSSSNTTFYMYYGEAQASDGADAESVWDSNFETVQHMDDTTASTITDSTSNNHDGTKDAASEPMGADGKVGKAQDFDGSSDTDNIDCGTDTGLNLTDTLTIEAWVNLENYNSGSSSTIVNRYQYWFYIYDTTGELTFLAMNGGPFDLVQTDAAISTGAWTYVAVTYDKDIANETTLYINYDDEIKVGDLDGPIDSETVRSFAIGDRLDDHYFEGVIDEVRVSSSVRPAAWIEASYHSGNDSLLSFGSETNAVWPSSSSEVWVKVPSIPTGDSTIYMYYGNSGASAASSVSDTFSSGSFTDSFTDQTKISSSTNIAVSGGEATLDLIYSDEFNDGSLDSKWTWLNEPGCWGTGGSWDEGTTTPGRLHIVSDQSVDFRGAYDNGHFLYQEISGDFEIETKLYGVPQQHWEQSGIFVRQDADNFFKCGYGGKVVLFILGRGAAVFSEVGGSYSALREISDDGSPKYFRLTRTGDLWQSWYHEEGTAVWTALHSWTQALTDPVKIGLAVGDGASGGGTNYATDVDYFRVNRYPTTGNLTSVTIPTDTSTRFAVGTQLSWNDTEPSGADLKYQVYYLDGSWQLIPDADLSGNSTGFDTSPVDISSVTTDYGQIRLKASFTSDTSVTPSLQDWTMTYYYRQYTSTEPTAGSPGTEEFEHYASGTIASKVFDTGKAGATWMSLSWAETLPAGTDITFEVRASDTSFLKDAAAPSWTPVGGTSPVTSGLPSGQYQQWRATLVTSGTDTPVLEDVRVLYS